MNLSIYIFLIIFLTLPYFIVYFRNLIWDVYLWQVKEYRIDRLLSSIFIEKLKGVRHSLMSYFKIALLTGIIIAFFTSYVEQMLFLSAVAFFIYWYESMDFFPKLIRKKLHRPNLKSPRNLILILGTFLFLLLPSIWLSLSLPSQNILNTQGPITDNVLTPAQLARDISPIRHDDTLIFKAEYLILFWVNVFGIFMELMAPIFTGLLVILTRPLAFFKRKSLISQARQKLMDHPRIKVIAVTGSYGKSTTKEILYQLLAPFYETIKTQKNNNTDVGIARTILKDLKKDTEVFIAEMGAYKLGETRDCCYVAPPDIAIITGVDQQHLSLYGSIKAVLDSTYEVVEELKEGGLVIFNGDNEYCLKLAERANTRKQFYFTVDSVEKLVAHNYDKKRKTESGHFYPAPDNISVSEIKRTPKGLQLRMRYRQGEYLLKTDLQAGYNIANLMAALLVALELGLPMDKLSKVINNMTFQVPYLNVKEGRNGTQILDDGYNANFTGFIAALDHLKSINVKGRKYIFTQGIIELGSERDSTYKQLAKAIIENTDGTFTTDKDLYDQLKETDYKYFCKYVPLVFDIPIYFKTAINEGDLILMEGPFPYEVLKQIYAKYP